jgi:hypothetical protein
MPPGGGGGGGQQQQQPWVNPENQVPGQHLKQYGVDLTELAEQNKLDPVIGRHEEIRRTIQILARRTKVSPVEAKRVEWSEKSSESNESLSLLCVLVEPRTILS